MSNAASMDPNYGDSAGAKFGIAFGVWFFVLLYVLINGIWLAIAPVVIAGAVVVYFAVAASKGSARIR